MPTRPQRSEGELAAAPYTRYDRALEPGEKRERRNARRTDKDGFTTPSVVLQRFFRQVRSMCDL